MEKNHENILDLMITCDGEVCEIIHNMESPNATTHDMWKALQEKFQPEEIEDYIDLTNQFNRCMCCKYRLTRVFSGMFNPEDTHLGRLVLG
jgi:hypothetical protein